jgi:methylglutaconyl-CoA hydratase
MTTNENGTVTYTNKNKVGTIEFYHPKGNSLPGVLLRKLAETINKAGEDEKNHVIILRSAGNGAFCAGASFDELSSITNFEEGKEFFMGFAHVINAMRTCPKFIISRVQGKTVGGGIGVIAASDFCIAQKGADIKLSELTLGIGPFVVGPAVGRKVGTSAFCTLGIDATTWYDSQWALEHGLYNHLAESTAELDTKVHELSKNLASTNPEAMKNLKEIYWQGTGHWGSTLEQRAEISGRLILSSFSREYLSNINS